MLSTKVCSKVGEKRRLCINPLHHVSAVSGLGASVPRAPARRGPAASGQPCAQHDGRRRLCHMAAPRRAAGWGRRRGGRRGAGTGVAPAVTRVCTGMLAVLVTGVGAARAPFTASSTPGRYNEYVGNFQRHYRLSMEHTMNSYNTPISRYVFTIPLQACFA